MAKQARVCFGPGMKIGAQRRTPMTSIAGQGPGCQFVEGRTCLPTRLRQGASWALLQHCRVVAVTTEYCRQTEWHVHHTLKTCSLPSTARHPAWLHMIPCACRLISSRSSHSSRARTAATHMPSCFTPIQVHTQI